jgi:hypothetical protein
MSVCAGLFGPIEHWWDTPADPNRFLRWDAVKYRKHRIDLQNFLVEHGILVYSPHNAFKGPWDERMQEINDWVVRHVDVLINMQPPGIPIRGTAVEIALGRALLKPIFNCPPGHDFNKLLAQIKETA